MLMKKQSTWSMRAVHSAPLVLRENNMGRRYGRLSCRLHIRGDTSYCSRYFAAAANKP